MKPWGHMPGGSNRVASIYEKPETSSKIRISKVPPECKKFKDKLEKSDRVNIPPVKLEIAESRNIRPVHINKNYDVSYHMRKPAREEFWEIDKCRNTGAM